ncbi:hypothetical protein BsWGS_12726 [Bradybaena similaris]
MSESMSEEGTAEKTNVLTIEDRDDISCFSKSFTEESLHSEPILKHSSISVARRTPVILNIDVTTSAVGKLHPVHAVNVAVVLEELSDRLAVLGKGLSAPMIDVRTASSILFDQAHRPQVHLNHRRSVSLSGDQWILRQQYDTVLPRRINQVNRTLLTPRTRIADAVKGIEVLQQTSHGKTEISRAFAQDVIDRTLAELVQDFGFQTLIQAVQDIQKKQSQDFIQVQSYWKTKQDIKRLKEEFKEVSSDKVAESKRLQIAMWELQDNLQEHNSRYGLENNYMVNSCDMRRSKSKKLCNAKENVIQEELVDMKKKNELENSVHAAMVHIINKLKAEAEVKLEYWLDKYEVDKENLTHWLDSLKADRAQCLERIAWIKEMTANYKPIVKDDRRVKKIEADRLARMELMTKRAVRIQAWWRGTMVRKALGPYSRKNTKKDTKKKAGGKKKKKKK